MNKSNTASCSNPTLARTLTVWLSLFVGLAFSLSSIVAFASGFSGLFYATVRTAGALLLFTWLTGALTSVSFARNLASKILVAVLLTVFVLPGLILCALPVTAPDALIHHLAVPKWWLAAGAPFPLFWHEWSFYPMLLNWAYVGAIAGPGDCVAAFCHWLLLVPLAALIGILCQESSESENSGLIGFTIAISLPLFIRLSSVPLVDLGLTMFSASTTLFLVRLLRTPDARWVNAIGAGASLGCALSTKYNGLLFSVVVLFAFFVTAIRSHLKLSKAALVTWVVGLTALCIFLPWLLKNYSWTGNPVFPLLKGTFGGPSLNLPGAPKGIPPFIHRISLYDEGWLDLLLLPFRMFVSGADGDPRRFDGVLSPVLLFAFLPIFVRKKRPELSFLLLVFLGYLFLCIAFSGARVRYLAPMIPAAIACVCIALEQISRTTRFRCIPWGVISAHLLLAGLYVSSLLREPAVPDLLSGTLDRREYLSTRIAEFPVIDYVNSNLRRNDKVYLVATGNSFYYFDRPVFSRGYYSSNEVLSWLRSGNSAEKIRENFANLGVSYLLVNTERFLKLVHPMLTPEQVRVWNSFTQNNLSLAFEARGYSLWVIR